MPVRWTVRSKEVHTSKAIWLGEKPRDGGVALVLEALQWARDNRQSGRMTLNLGMGGSVSALEFEQSESVPSSALVDDYDQNGSNGSNPQS